jgi:hypothetical protein
MSQPLTWSFSALKEYKTCARKYHASRVLKLYPMQDTDATRYGKEVHTAAELYVRDGTPIPKGLEFLTPILDALIAIPGEKLCELEMALKPDCSPCDFHDEARWVRGIADLVIINGDKARVCDYKSGSARYPDKTQLELMSLMIFAHYPEVQSVKGALLFVHHDVVIKGMYKRADSDKMWAKWRTDVAMIEASMEGDRWPPNPSGLCRKWCPVEHCEHRG